MGYANTYKREYRCWNMLKNACNDKQNKRYRLYGGQGITFDKSWLSFEVFLDDMGTMPKDCDGLKLSNQSAGYTKLNCSWAKMKRGFKKGSTDHIKNPRKRIEKSIAVCFSINHDHYQFIKRQALSRSNQTGEVYTTNDLIREALAKFFPFSGQFDMFGGAKK